MFGRLQIIIVGGILLIGILSGIYYSWRSSIEREALLEYNQKQLEQTIKDQEEFRIKMLAIQKSQDEIVNENNKSRKIFDDQIKTTDEYLESTAVKNADKPSSDILKETIKKLKDISK
jgi:Fe2+ transport system protein B